MKNDELLALEAKSVRLKGIMLSKTSQTQRKRHRCRRIIYSHLTDKKQINEWKAKNKMNEVSVKVQMWHLEKGLRGGEPANRRMERYDLRTHVL